MTIVAQKGSFQFGLQYTKYKDGNLAVSPNKWTGVLTDLPVAAETVVVDATTYTWRASVTTTANDVKIGATIAISLANLAAAINAGAGSGTLYGSLTTANASISAVAENNTIFLTAITAGKAGNILTVSSTDGDMVITNLLVGLDAGVFDPTKIVYLKHRAREITYDAENMQSVLPLEVGGDIEPTGAYKSGVAVGGGASILPRLQSDIGALLLGAFGKVTTATDTPVAGVNKHTFTMDATNQDKIPWMAVRKMIPGAAGVRAKGVTGYDNKVASLRFTIPQAAPIEARIEFMGRVPAFDNYPESWLTGSGYEDYLSLPLSCKGSFYIPNIQAAAEPVTQVILELVNNLTSPRQEMIVGSYFMDDIAVLSRALTLRFAYKWYDPTLYDYSMGNAANITDWSPQPFVQEKSGGNYAFQLDMIAPFFVTGTTPYQLTVRATKCFFEPVGGVNLVGGGLVMQEYRGTVLVPTSPSDPYAEFILYNGVSGYSVPTQ